MSSKPQVKKYLSSAGVEIAVREKALVLADALGEVISAIDSKKGAIFSSGFDYPGRHSRWDIGFVDPALEFISRGRSFALNALNEQGRLLLPLLSETLSSNDDVLNITVAEDLVSGKVKTPPDFFPEEERSRQPSIFSVLRTIISLFRNDEEALSHLGLYGAFGYDLVHQFETVELKLDRNDDFNDCHLYLPLEIVIVDRRKEVARKFAYSINTPKGDTSSVSGGGNSLPSEHLPKNNSKEIACDHKPGEFAQKVQKIIDGTKRGDYFEVVLSQSFSLPCTETATNLFHRIAEVNPSPYMFLINFGNEQLIGASPEVFVRVNGRRYETCPIAGTVPRGETPLEDAERVRELLSSKKEESELTMCTDVDRNDMARVCVPGSVKVIGRRELEFYSHVIHTVDHVEGKLAEGIDAIDAFQSHMWACTVTGAPKPAALQEIEDLEKSPRRWYSGAVGYLGSNGDINTGITLRAAELRRGTATVRAGATLLHGCDPDKEEQETRAKAAAFLSVLSGEKLNLKQSSKSFVANAIERKVLLIDCQDSFVHNLAAYLREFKAEITTLRVGFPLAMLEDLNPDLVLISPGPETPEHFGLPDLVGEFVTRKIPIFGVCLGHQAIGQHFGAKLTELPAPLHGKPITIKHNQSELFSGLGTEFSAGLYHSLYLPEESIPECLEVTAHATAEFNGKEITIPMAIRHRSLPVAGVQFHPESLMSLKKNIGHRIIKNVLSVLK